MSLVERYRKSKLFKVELPSTLEDGTHPVFTVRKPNAERLMKFMAVLNIEPSEDINLMKQRYMDLIKSEQGPKRVAEALTDILIDCVVEPKLTSEVNCETMLHVDEIDFEDQHALLDAIMSLAGFSKEKEEQRRSFR